MQYNIVTAVELWEMLWAGNWRNNYPERDSNYWIMKQNNVENMETEEEKQEESERKCGEYGRECK